MAGRRSGVSVERGADEGTVGMSADDQGFARSQTDLMAGVAGVFFVLMAVFLVRDARNDRRDRERLQALEREDKAEGRARELVLTSLQELQRELDGLREELNGAGFESVLSNNELEINLDPAGTTLLFESGKDTLDCTVVEAARMRVRRALDVVCRVLRKRRVALIKNIVLEGHTDNVRVVRDRSASNECRVDEVAETRVAVFGGNVALSSRRAVHVLRLVMEDSETSTELRQCVEDHFLIAGRGPVQPLDERGRTIVGADWLETAASAESLRRSRRVVLRVSGRQDFGQLAKELGG